MNSVAPSVKQHLGRAACRPARGTRRLRVIAMAPPKQMLIYSPPHPLVKHWLGVIRSKDQPPAIFRSAAAELGRILIYEAAREWLPTADAQVETPLGVAADATFVDPMQPVKVVPILRAGLVLLEKAEMVLPISQTYHVGFARDENTLQATCYLNKLPPRFSPEDRILVSDIMLATGGTCLQVLDDLVARGASPDKIRVVCILCAPPALQLLGERYPGLVLYCACIDPEVDQNGFIVPGCGDAGDRAFGA